MQQGSREGFILSSKHAVRLGQALSLFCRGSQLTKLWIGLTTYTTTNREFLTTRVKGLQPLGNNCMTQVGWLGRSFRLDISRERWCLPYDQGKCCKFIPGNTATGGTFTTAMNKIKDLNGELKRNAGGSDWWWGGLDGILGTQGAMVVKVGMTVLIVLIMISLLVRCIIPILRKWLLQLMFRQRVEATRLQLTLRV